MNQTINKDSINHFPFWVFTAGIFIIAILPSLVQDGMFIDGIQYAALLNAFIMVSIWRLVTRSNKEIQRLAWLPVLFWLSMPIVFRSFQMNVSENTIP